MKKHKTLSISLYLILPSALIYIISFLFYEIYFCDILSDFGRMKFCLNYGLSVLEIKKCVFVLRTMCSVVISFFLIMYIIYSILDNVDSKRLRIKKILTAFITLLFLISCLFLYYSFEIKHLKTDNIFLGIAILYLFLIIIQLLIVSIKIKNTSNNKASSWFLIVSVVIILLIFVFCFTVVLFWFAAWKMHLM